MLELRFKVRKKACTSTKKEQEGIATSSPEKKSVDLINK